jgi:integrase
LTLRKATAERDSGQVFEVENITLAEYLDRWLNGPVKTKNLKPITYEQYQRQVRVHIVPSLGRVKLRNLSPEVVQDLYDSKIAAGLKPASVRYIHAVLHNALEHAHKRRKPTLRRFGHPKSNRSTPSRQEHYWMRPVPSTWAAFTSWR